MRTILEIAPIHDRRDRVTGGVTVVRDVTQVRAMSQKMSHLAQYDYPTDLPNRLLLNDGLTQAISSAHRHHRHPAVLFIDIDRFKHVNYSLGHVIGDKLVASIAERLVGCVRSSDTVSRQGGDEFVILLSVKSFNREFSSLPNGGPDFPNASSDDLHIYLGLLTTAYEAIEDYIHGCES